MLAHNLLLLGRSGAVPDLVHLSSALGALSLFCPLCGVTKQSTENSGASVWLGALLWIQALQVLAAGFADRQQTEDNVCL